MIVNKANIKYINHSKGFLQIKGENRNIPFTRKKDGKIEIDYKPISIFNKQTIVD